MIPVNIIRYSVYQFISLCFNSICVNLRPVLRSAWMIHHVQSCFCLKIVFATREPNDLTGFYESMPKLTCIFFGYEALKKKPDLRKKPWPTFSRSAKDFVNKPQMNDAAVRLTAALTYCK